MSTHRPLRFGALFNGSFTSQRVAEVARRLEGAGSQHVAARFKLAEVELDWRYHARAIHGRWTCAHCLGYP